MEDAIDRGILAVPLIADWEDRSFVAHIVPIWTRQRYSYWLFFHLSFCKFCAFPVEHPAVPKGQSRFRIVFYANNTESETEGLVAAVAEWAQEMIDIEDGGGSGDKIPKAARQVYAWMGDESAALH